MEKEGFKPTVAPGSRAKNVRKAGDIKIKVAETRDKLNKLNDKYKNSNSAIAKFNKGLKEDRLVRNLGKYALKRERGTFFQRHGKLVGSLAGSYTGNILLAAGFNLPAAAVGSAIGVAAGIGTGVATNRVSRRAEGRRLLNAN